MFITQFFARLLRSFSSGSGGNYGGPVEPRLVDRRVVIENRFFLEDPLPLNIVDPTANIQHLEQFLKYLNAFFNRPQIEQISYLEIEIALKHMETMGGGELYSLAVDGGYDKNTNRGSHAVLLVKGHVPICVWYGSRLGTSSHDMECEGLLQGYRLFDFLKFLHLTENDTVLREKLLADFEHADHSILKSDQSVTGKLLTDNKNAVDVMHAKKYRERAQRWSEVISIRDLRQKAERSELSLMHLSNRFNFITDAFAKLALELHSGIAPMTYRRINFCDQPPNFVTNLGSNMLSMRRFLTLNMITQILYTILLWESFYREHFTFCIWMIVVTITMTIEFILSMRNGIIDREIARIWAQPIYVGTRRKRRWTSLVETLVIVLVCIISVIYFYSRSLHMPLSSVSCHLRCFRCFRYFRKSIGSIGLGSYIFLMMNRFHGY